MSCYGSHFLQVFCGFKIYPRGSPVTNHDQSLRTLGTYGIVDPPRPLPPPPPKEGNRGPGKED